MFGDYQKAIEILKGLRKESHNIVETHILTRAIEVIQNAWDAEEADFAQRAREERIINLTDEVKENDIQN